MGKTGAGCGEEQGVQDEIDLFFSTFAKSMASIGAFVSGNADIIDNLRYKSDLRYLLNHYQCHLLLVISKG